MRNTEAIRALDADLRTIFAGRLQCLVVYGESPASHGPVSAMAVVEALTPDDLARCAGRVKTWHAGGLSTPLVMEAAEFASSLDAFPFEFGTILANHTVVSGTSPFKGLAVDPGDLRRACEVQARSHLLHLREGYIEAQGQADHVADLVTRSARAVAALLQNVGRMAPPPAPSPVLVRIAELAHGGTISTDEAGRLMPDYLVALSELVSALDAWSAA